MSSAGPLATFGKYELVARLARGGMAETYRAQLKGAAGVTKQVVIKKVLPHFAEDELFIEAFINEAKISASLSHGNIAQVFDFGRVEGDYFIAMELVDGRSLNQVLTRAQEKGFAKLPVPIACFLGMEVLKGLHYAHTRVGPDGKPLSLVHRDVSPENVLISFEGDVKVVDFGVAKAVMRGRRETEPGLVKGKFLFFSPEQAVADPVDARSDVYAVGILLYRMLCGSLPFEGQMHTVMRAIVAGRFVPASVVNPALPAALVTALNRAMATKRDERFASALQLQEALASFLYRQEPTFSSETVKEWMTWLFRPELSSDGRPTRLSGRFEAQLTKWGATGNAGPIPEVETAPGVRAVTRPAAETKPEAVAGAPFSSSLAPWLALAALVAVGAIGTAVVVGAESEPAAPVPVGIAPLKPKVEAVDVVDFPADAVVSGERHRLRLEQISLPELTFGREQNTLMIEVEPQRAHAPLFAVSRSARAASDGEVGVVLGSALKPRTFSALKVFDFQPFRESLGGQMRTLQVGNQTKSFSDTAAQVDARAGHWVTVRGVKGAVRLTLSPVTPALWANRPRPASVVVAWQRAPGYRALDEAEWPGGATRAVLTQGTPLDVDGASVFAIANADAQASSEAESVIVKFSTPPPRDPEAPAPVAAPVPAREVEVEEAPPPGQPTTNEALFRANQSRLMACLMAPAVTAVAVRVRVELGVVTGVTLDPAPKNQAGIVKCLLSEARQWEFFVEKGPARTYVFRFPQDLSIARGAAVPPIVRPAPMRVQSPAPSTGASFSEVGLRLMRDRQYSAAKNTLEQCVRVEPKNADCHKLLGTVWAKLGDPDRGAREYKEFLRLAPRDHPDVEKVKSIINQYEGVR